jgi:hypothetical protein
MINSFYEKIAKLAVNYAVGVKKGQRVLRKKRSKSIRCWTCRSARALSSNLC